MNSWLAPSVIAFLCWGLWAFFPKLAVQYIEPKSALVYHAIGAFSVAVVVLFVLDFKLEFDIRGAGYAFATGVLGLAGSLAYLYAVAKGPVSLIAILTALYPVITLVIAYFVLQEPITVKQAFGVVLAFIAIGLLST